MKLLYLNNELAVADGCNAHALGMLNAMKRIIGEENILTYPDAQDCSGKKEKKSTSILREKLAPLLQVVRYYRKTIKSYTLSKQLYNEMERRTFKPTHIWVRSSVFEKTAIFLAKKTGAKLICEMNTPFYYEWCVIRKLPLRNKVEKWERNLLNSSECIYVVSEVLKKMYIEHYNIVANKIVVIPNGYDAELYKDWEIDYEMTRNEIRQKQKLEDKFVVTFIGSLKIWHGIDKFCAVADKLEQYSNIHFLVLGDGEMRSLLTKYADSHDNMTFVGKVDFVTMKKYMYASDIGIMPYSAGDEFYFSPLKMYDMIGGHLPFLGTNVGQIAEVCQEQLSDDFLVDGNSVDELSNKILEVMREKKKLSAMQEVVNECRYEFTWDHRAFKLFEVMQ